MSDPIADQILKRYDRAQSFRSTWDSFFQDLKELVRPNAADFNRQTYPGQSNVDRIFDGTAPKAAQELAAGLHSRVSNPTSRWFMVAHPDVALLEDDEVLTWLEDVSDTMFMHYALPEVGTNLALHENYLDLGTFGTSILFQDRDFRSRLPVLRAFPLGSCWALENVSGKVDTVFHEEQLTTRQVIQLFGPDTPPKIMEERDQDKLWPIVHAVMPRADRGVNSLASTSMPFASFWLSKDHKVLIRESGYDTNPFHVSRWTKTAGEIYGRSPAMDCFPDIRMLNAMSKTVIRAAQKIVDPPIICDDDGVLLPLKTFPGATILKTPGTDKPEPLITGGRVDIGLEMMNQRRDQIMKCFFVDYIRREMKKERQSQLEIYDSRNEMDQQMSAIVGRIQDELHGPMLRRTFNMLLEVGVFPKAPRKLLASGKKLQITFISPAARAQMSSKIIALQQAMQDVAAFASVNPTILDVVDTDRAAQMIFTLRDVSRKIMRTPEEIDAIRQQRTAAAQLSQAAEVGATAAGGLKDLAQAQALRAQAAQAA